MNHFIHLLKYEFKIYHRNYHIVRHSAYICLLSSIILAIMLNNETNSIYSKMILIIFGNIISAITIPSYLIKNDMQDGFLENLLTSLKPSRIIIAKYIGLFVSVIAGSLFALPFTILFYSITNIHDIAYIIIITILLLSQLMAIILLSNIIHAYFKQNTNVILSIIAPLIIPSLIISSMAIHTLKNDFIFILVGIDLIFIPIILVLANYLLSNLYEF